MKFHELNDWAISTFNKKNDELLALGVNDKKLSKIKSILRDGISARCKLVIINTEKNNKYIGEIEGFIKQLTDYGLNPLGQVPQTKAEQPKEQPVNVSK